MRTISRPIDILIVEDDPGDEMLIVEALEEHEVANARHVVRDGQQALDFLYRTGEYHAAPRPGLVLLDLNLPKYTGHEVLERVKEDPDLCDIPVVMLTTSSSEDDVLGSYRRHANAYVTKPVDLIQFIDAIKKIDDFFVTVVALPEHH